MSSQEIKRLIVRYFGPMLRKTQSYNVSSTQQVVLECKNELQKPLINNHLSNPQSITHVGNVVLGKKQS